MTPYANALSAPCLTLPTGHGRLHLAARVDATWSCRHRRDHRRAGPGEVTLALRLAPGAAAPLRQLLLDSGWSQDARRLSDTEIGIEVRALLAAGRLVAVHCGQGCRAPKDRLPPPSVPLHLGIAGTDFDGCWHHRCHVALDLADAALVHQLVQRFAGTPTLRSAVRRAGGSVDIDGAAAAERAVELLLAGKLCAAMCPMPKGPAARIAAAAAPARPAAPTSHTRVVEPRRRQLAKTWIEVHLVRGRDRAVVAGAHYRLELADGTVRHGRSDDRGIIYEKNVEAGDCQLALLDYDRNEWRRI